ncbi:hypothetical protein RQP46_009552 [Phenoliferia psychrophenolica]
MLQAALLSFALLSVASAQQVGTNTAEVHPKLTIEECSAGGTCTTIDSSIVLDGNWRWTHDVSGYTNCYTGNSWSTTLCPDPETCTTNCALDGAAYESTYGITTTGSSVTLDFVTGSNVGSRVYLMDENDENYRLFQLKNQEFTFDVDVSNLPCGAGAKYGTGYCDAQCPHDIKFINGQANSQNWTGTDANSGTGHYGSCCIEMDIWEANKISTAVTPHVCSSQGQTRCEGTACGDTDAGERDDGICDKDGCDFNPYRMGDHSFFGPGMTVDTSKVMTVVTQFVTSDNTSTGTLSEIRRLYVQDGTVIANSVSTNLPAEYDSITDDFCNAQKTTFGDTNTFEKIGGLATMGDALETGLVLVMSLWDDSTAEMLWLDSNDPATGDASTAGVARGTCATTSGVPADVRSASPGSSFSNIKFGPIGSTYSGTAAVASSSSAAVLAATSSAAAVASSSKIVTSVKTSAATKATTSSAKATTSSKAIASSSKATTSSAVKVTSTAPATSSAVQQTTSAAIVAKSTSTAAAATTSSASTVCAVAYAQCGGASFIGATCCPSGWSCTDYNPYYSQCTQD